MLLTTPQKPLHTLQQVQDKGIHLQKNLHVILATIQGHCPSRITSLDLRVGGPLEATSEPQTDRELTCGSNFAGRVPDPTSAQHEGVRQMDFPSGSPLPSNLRPSRPCLKVSTPPFSRFSWVGGALGLNRRPLSEKGKCTLRQTQPQCTVYLWVSSSLRFWPNNQLLLGSSLRLLRCLHF